MAPSDVSVIVAWPENDIRACRCERHALELSRWDDEREACLADMAMILKGFGRCLVVVGHHREWFGVLAAFATLLSEVRVGLDALGIPAMDRWALDKTMWKSRADKGQRAWQSNADEPSKGVPVNGMPVLLQLLTHQVSHPAAVRYRAQVGHEIRPHRTSLTLVPPLFRRPRMSGRKILPSVRRSRALWCRRRRRSGG